MTAPGGPGAPGALWAPGAPPVPRVTLSLVTWNGLRWLPACLDSVESQTLTDWELLVVDNGSVDGSVAWLRERLEGDERARLVELPRNTGYAAAHDRSIRVARGEAVLLLNQDVVLDPGFLAAGMAALDAHPEAASVQGLLRRLGPDGERQDPIDSTGLVMRRDRRVVSRDQLARARRVRPAGEVWGADGPAPLYRRAALMHARVPRRGGGWEVLDEDFFAQKEDADLAWRLRRLGWTCRYEPRALAWHARGGGDSGAAGLRSGVRANLANSPDSRVRAWCNQRLMQLKNDDLRSALRDLPWIVRRELGQLAFMLVADRERLAAVPAFLRLAPWALRKRRALQRAAARPRST